MKTSTIRSGDLCFETDKYGNLRIVRQTDGTSIELSISELELLCQVMSLRGAISSPPTHPGTTEEMAPG